MARPHVYDAGPPCVSRAVDAFLRMGMDRLLDVLFNNQMHFYQDQGVAGVSWGLFMGSYDAGKQGHAGISRVMYVAKAAAKNSLGWGFFGGMYMGLNCGFEALRRKRDWKNAMVSGAITGAMAGSLRSGRVVSSAVAASAITTTIEFLRPVEYPPTGGGRSVQLGNKNR